MWGQIHEGTYILGTLPLSGIHSPKLSSQAPPMMHGLSLAMGFTENSKMTGEMPKLVNRQSQGEGCDLNPAPAKQSGVSLH